MIQLTEDLAVTADTLQYIVGTPVRRVFKGATSVEMKNPKYYPTLAQAVRGAVKKALRDKVAKEEIKSLKEFLFECEKIEAEFKRMLEPLER